MVVIKKSESIRHARKSKTNVENRKIHGEECRINYILEETVSGIRRNARRYIQSRTAVKAPAKKCIFENMVASEEKGKNEFASERLG